MFKNYQASNNDAEARIDSKNEYVELNLDQKVTVKNIAGWPVSFAALSSPIPNASIGIPAEGKERITRSEILAQVQNENKLFNGIDGNGGHATLFIDDAPTRREVGFDSEDGKEKQLVFSDDTVVKLFNLKSQEAFEKNFKKTFVTRAEKYAVVRAIEKLGINDFKKIRFAESYTGFKINL